MCMDKIYIFNYLIHNPQVFTLTKAGKGCLPEARELIKKFDETLFNIRDMNAYHRVWVTRSVYSDRSILLPLAIGKFNELRS